MIKELRIGNLVIYYGRQAVVCSINYITKKVGIVQKKGTYKEVFVDDLSSMYLSEDSLKNNKIGFKTESIVSLLIEYKEFQFRLVRNKDWALVVNKKISDENFSTSIFRILTIHELQNIFFMFTKKELI
jgi:hypothetical protein